MEMIYALDKMFVTTKKHRASTKLQTLPLRKENVLKQQAMVGIMRFKKHQGVTTSP